ncbi:MAG TPA: glutamate-cysteine ligase family protein [Vicinamibacteria bacterium]
MTLHLFEGYGIEIEYMLVSIEDLAIVSGSDRALASLAGEVRTEVEVDSCAWSNELVLHVMELKNVEPASSLAPLGDVFSGHVRRMNALLEPMGAMLMPGAMHPFMRPRDETRLWPHEGREVYQAFDRVYDCRRHGWANLQSAQLNLSFGNDEEFGRLHAATRVLLPILASLAASSPVVEGELTPYASTRLEVYRSNGRKTPAVTGQVIPEPIFSQKEYESRIYGEMYREIAPFDPEGTLHHPWLNARGTIPKFDRGALEIRVMDAQECPAADLAIAAVASAVLKALVSENFSDHERQRSFETTSLVDIFLGTLKEAEQTVLRNQDYLRLFAFPDRTGTAHELWLYLVETLRDAEGVDSPHLRVILEEGPLARRIVRALGTEPPSEEIAVVYRALCESLEAGSSFTGL